MTKNEIIAHLKAGTEWQMGIAENLQTLPIFNELLKEGAIRHVAYDSRSLIPTNNPNLAVGTSNFSLVEGFDYSKYED